MDTSSSHPEQETVAVSEPISENRHSRRSRHHTLNTPLSEFVHSVRGLSDIDFVGGDVTEVAPTYDVGDITALAAATIALEFLCLCAAKSTRRPPQSRPFRGAGPGLEAPEEP